MKSTQPIGIFDSGIGGLTVAREVKKALPNERLIYFGDTAHLPYGDKSTAAVQAYSVRIADMLLKKRCKVILIACNSASAAAYELVKEYVGKRAQVFDVINPTVDFLRENYAGKLVGLIGTKQTVNSAVYSRKVGEQEQGITIQSLATPLLVPLIEEGIYGNEISEKIISGYLGDPVLKEIEALILGCTHYPIIKDEINAWFKRQNQEVSVIDSAETVAAALKAFLQFHQLINRDSQLDEDEFLVSDFTASFETTTRIFFGSEVHLEKLPIWDELV